MGAATETRTRSVSVKVRRATFAALFRPSPSTTERSSRGVLSMMAGHEGVHGHMLWARSSDTVDGRPIVCDSVFGVTWYGYEPRTVASATIAGGFADADGATFTLAAAGADFDITVETPAHQRLSESHECLAQLRAVAAR
jgi:hypothetical protein